MLEILANAAAQSSSAPTGSGTEALLVGAVVALANGLVEVLKAVFKKNGKNGSDGCSVCRTQVAAVHDLVNKTGSDGTPLIFGQPAVCKRIDIVADELKQLNRSQERLLRHFESRGSNDGDDV